MAVAISAQVTYGSLVAMADDDNISITAQMGLAVYLINWVAAGSALAGCVLRFIANRQISAGGGAKNGARGGRGFVRITPDETETEYKYSEKGNGVERLASETLMAPSPGMPGDISRNASEEDLSAMAAG